MNINFTIDYWTIVGFIGAFMFFSRFVIQWIASEIKKKSIIPKSFWYLSIAGSIILFTYSYHRNDIVFTLSMSLNTIIYVRNIMLLKNEQDK